MDAGALRASMEDFWLSVAQRAEDLKDPYVALERMDVAYEQLAAEAQREADKVLGEWLLTGNTLRSSVARGLIRSKHLTDTLPAVRVAAARAEAVDEIHHKNLAEMLRELIVELEGA